MQEKLEKLFCSTPKGGKVQVCPIIANYLSIAASAKTSDILLYNRIVGWAETIIKVDLLIKFQDCLYSLEQFVY